MPLLEVKNLKVYFPVKHGPSPRRSGFGHAGGMFSRVCEFVKTGGRRELQHRAGESGCGKTTPGRASALNLVLCACHAGRFPYASPCLNAACADVH